MKAGGKLLIAVRNDTLGPRFGATPPPGGPTEWVCLSVRDTGSGMPPEVQARLFEPFFTTKRLGHGTGLGLATVYGIVNQLGGRIAVRSELNKGTELSIWLPRELNAHLPTPKLESSPGLPVGNESVLVVEDEPLVRELTVRALRAAGHQVEEAGNGREALAVLAARAVPFDLIVTDVMMPELGGKELALEVRRARPEQRVLFVSGYPRDAVGSKGQLLEGTDFLGKPFTPRSLLRKVRAMLDAGRVGPRG
jgi:CheY-like chemotaxis protein